MARTIGKAVLVLAVLAVAFPPEAAPRPLPAAAVERRAAVVVHTGDVVKTACVRFTEESISGKEALERAQMDPVFRAYSGQGTAVCALCGKGCPADESCLTCGGNNYWSYHRARAGSGAYSPSAAGVSSTRVRDGDVEGWQWGPGTPPPYYTVEQLCPPAAQPNSDASPPGADPAPIPPDNPSPAAPPPPAAGAPSGRLAPQRVLTTGVPPSLTAETSTTVAAPADSVVPSTVAPIDEVAGAPTARVRQADDDEDSGGLSLVAFAALMTVLLGWATWARRRGRRAAPESSALES